MVVVVEINAILEENACDIQFCQVVDNYFTECVLSCLLNQTKGKHARQMPKQLGKVGGQI